MANPQCENGYTRISNEIFDKLCKTRINGESRQVLDFIFRKTYGFNKKKDRISLSQFESGTTLKKNHICKALNKLKIMKIIIQIKNDNGSVYEINKNYEEWEVVPKKGSPQKGNNPVPKKGIGVVPKKGHTKDKDTKDNTKDNKIDFEIFWEAYRNKKQKPKCIQKWNKLPLVEQQSILDYIPKYLETKKVKSGYQMHPATFLNNRCWEDEINDSDIDMSGWSDMTKIERMGIGWFSKQY